MEYFKTQYWDHFCFYSSDLPKLFLNHNECVCRWYQFMSEVRSIQECGNLQQELGKLKERSDRELLKLNPNKCNEDGKWWKQTEFENNFSGRSYKNQHGSPLDIKTKMSPDNHIGRLVKKKKRWLEIQLYNLPAQFLSSMSGINHWNQYISSLTNMTHNQP